MFAISELLAKAEKATPDKGKWTKFIPVVQKLQSNDYSPWAAVKWLVEQGEIAAADQRSAYHSILQALKRRGK